jgi:hypothetical protein
MKRKALIFALILTVLYFLNSLLFGQNISLVGSIAGSLVTGTVTFLFMLLLLLSIQRSLDNIIYGIINKHADLIAYTPMNYVKRYFINSTGGIGCLYKDKIVFIPHRINLSRKEYTLFFHDIESISNYRICGIKNSGLRIVLRSGETEKFVIDQASQFYKYLSSIIPIG